MMGLSAYVSRIIHNKIKVAVILFLFLIPLVDIGMIWYDFYLTGVVPDPRYASFNALYTVGNNHLLHKIMFWFLPMYLLVICGEDSVEDYDTGYRSILKSRFGKKGYVIRKTVNSFITAFLVVGCSLLLNYIILQIIFEPGGNIKMDEVSVQESIGTLYAIGYEKPVQMSLLNIFLTAVTAGYLGSMGNLIAMSLCDRKLIYAVMFLIWVVFINMDNGIMSLMHPFSDMTTGQYLTAWLILIAFYNGICILTAYVEVRSDDIS